MPMRRPWLITRRMHSAAMSAHGVWCCHLLFCGDGRRNFPRPPATRRSLGGRRVPESRRPASPNTRLFGYRRRQPGRRERRERHPGRRRGEGDAHGQPGVELRQRAHLRVPRSHSPPAGRREDRRGRERSDHADRRQPARRRRRTDRGVPQPDVRRRGRRGGAPDVDHAHEARRSGGEHHPDPRARQPGPLHGDLHDCGRLARALSPCATVQTFPDTDGDGSIDPLDALLDQADDPASGVIATDEEQLLQGRLRPGTSSRKTTRPERART